MKELDFLPASFHYAVRRRRRMRQNAFYSAVLAVALGGLYFSNESRVRSAEASLADLRSNNGETLAQVSRLALLETSKRALDQRAGLVNRLEDDAPLDAVIGEITRLMADSMAIRSLVIGPEPLEAPGHAANEGLGHRGRTRAVLVAVAATDVEVGIFFGRLSECPLFDEVSMSYSRETQEAGRQMRVFELAFTVKRVSLER